MVGFVAQSSWLVYCFTFPCWGYDVSVAARVRFNFCCGSGLSCPLEDPCQGVCFLKTTVGSPLAKICMALQKLGDFFLHSILKFQCIAEFCNAKFWKTLHRRKVALFCKYSAPPKNGIILPLFCNAKFWKNSAPPKSGIILPLFCIAKILKKCAPPKSGIILQEFCIAEKWQYSATILHR